MEETLTYILFAVYFIPLAIGIARWKRLTGDQRSLVAWVAFVVPFSLLSEYVGRRYGNNLPLYHLYAFLEFFFLYWLFRRVLRRIPLWAVLLPAVSFVGVGLWGAIENPFSVPDRLLSLESVILVGCALLFFYRALRSLEVQRIEQTFMFWISVAVLLCFAGNLLLYIFSNSVAEASDRVYFSVWTIHTLFTILLYLLYTVALLCKDPTPQSLPFSSSAH